MLTSVPENANNDGVAENDGGRDEENLEGDESWDTYEKMLAAKIRSEKEIFKEM